MAKLSEKFTLGGGESTAPVSVNQSKKLSDKFTLNPVNNTNAFRLPAKHVAQTEIPQVEQPSYDYQSVINEYESLPNTNIFNRIFSQESRDAYKRKQELQPDYEKAKDIQTASKLNSLNALDEVNKLWNDYEGHDDVYAPLYELLKSKGVTDQKELKELVNNIEATQKRQGLERANQYLTEFADEHPVAGSGFSVLARGINAPATVAETAIDYLSGKPLSNTSAPLSSNKTINQMRSTVSDDMNGAGKFLYGTGMSMADMLAARLFGGSAAPLAMGAEKYGDTVNEAIDQGLTPNRIMLKGISSGVTTWLTEKYLTMPKLDALKEMGFAALGKEGGKKVVLRALNAAGLAEGIQEGSEDIADWIADWLIAGDKNEFNQAYNSYKEQGLSDKEAVAKVIGDKTVELLTDAAGGYLSGFVGGGAEMTMGGIAQKLDNKRNEIPALNQQTEQAQAEIPKVNEEITTPDVNENAKPKLSETFTVDDQLTNGNEKAYNQNTTTEVEKGVLNNGRETDIGNDGQGSERVSGKLPETERPRPDMVYQGDAKGVNTPSGSSGDTSVLGYDNRVYSEDMDTDPSISSFDFRYSNNNAQDFHDNFEKAKASNDHGGAVDSHSIEELQEIVKDGGSLFMSADKTAFGAVTGDGNLTSVAKAKNSPHKGAAMNIAKTAVKLGATKGDCYGQNLVNMYSRAGFVPVARCEYGYGFNDAMDAQVKEQMANGEINKEPDVYALAYDPNADTNKIWSMDELNSLPLYEGENAYDDMLAYRDSLLKNPNIDKNVATTPERIESLKAQSKPIQNKNNVIEQLEATTPETKEIESLEKPKKKEKRAKVMYEDYGINPNTVEDYDNDSEGVTMEIDLDNGVPTITDENGTTSQVATNSLYKFFQYDKEGVDHLIENIQAGKFQKKSKSMQKAYENAIDQIAKYGAIAKYDDIMQNGIQTDDDLALAHNLLTYYYKKGDMVRVDMLMSKIQQSGTEIGRALHFFNMFGDSPLGVQQTTAKLAGTKTKEFVNEAKKNPRGKKAKQYDQVQKASEDIVEKTKEIKERKKKSAKLARALRYNVEQKLKQQKGSVPSAPKTFDMILEEVNNTLEDEYASVNFSDEARQYFATMIQDGVETEIMADEIDHYMKHGTFYPLEQEVNVPKPTSKKLDGILARMGNDTVSEEMAPKTYDQIREEVKNSLEKEMASIDFTDAEISYLSRLIEYGATNEEITNAIAQKLATGYMTMSEEDIEMITKLYDMADNAETSKESAEYKQQAAAIASKYLGDATFMDKWNAWRYLAMLGNPRTMVRNILGNTMFGAVTDVKDAVGALIESKFVKEGERTKAILTPKDKALINACANDFDRVAYEEATKGGHKYNMKSEIESQRKIFDSKLLEWGKNKTNNTLEDWDIKALRVKYKKALAGYLKANGYDASILNTDSEVATKARDYAIKQAKEATFHADNALAEVLSRASNNLRQRGDAIGKVGEVAIESLAPFKKTPANILQQGIEYSPLGIVKFLSQIHSKADATACIDSLSKSLTGSAILALGAWLASQGVLIGKRDEEDDPFRKGSDYALKIGNHTYTIDWMAPAALPLFAGAELYKAFNPNETADEAKNFWETMASLADPVLEMSMLQGLNNMMNTLASSKKSGLGSTMTDIAAGYASQSIPTLAGQIARTIDPYRRSTRTNTSSYTNPALANLEKAGMKAVNKIPFLSMANEKYLDAWGEPQKNNGGNIVGRAFQNFISPGYWNDTSLSNREQKLAKLEKTYTGNGSLIPSLADNNKPTGGRLTNAEYTKWAKTRGSELKLAVDAALNYSGRLKESDLQDYIHDIENFANAVAKNKQFGTPIPKTYKNVYQAYVDGKKSYKAVMDYYINKSKK